MYFCGKKKGAKDKPDWFMAWRIKSVYLWLSICELFHLFVNRQFLCASDMRSNEWASNPPSRHTIDDERLRQAEPSAAHSMAECLR